MHVWFSVCLCVCVCRSEEHTSELQSHLNLVCRLLLEKKKTVQLGTATAFVVFTTVYSSHRTLLCAVHTTQPRPPPTYALSLTHSCASFFFNDTATTEIYTLSLHDALPISSPLFFSLLLSSHLLSSPLLL